MTKSAEDLTFVARFPSDFRPFTIELGNRTPMSKAPVASGGFLFHELSFTLAIT